jgi:hypothetical protein
MQLLNGVGLFELRSLTGGAASDGALVSQVLQGIGHEEVGDADCWLGRPRLSCVLPYRTFSRGVGVMRTLLVLLLMTTATMAQFRTAPPNGSRPGTATRLDKYVNKYPSEPLRGVVFLTLIQKPFVGKFGLEKWNRFLADTKERPITVEDNDAIGAKLKLFRCLPHACDSENSVLFVNLEDGSPFVVCFYKELVDAKTKTAFADIEFAGDNWFVHTRFPKGSYNTGGSSKPHYTNCDDGWDSVYFDVFGPE